MKPDDAELLMQCHRAGRPTEACLSKALDYVASHDTLRMRLEEQTRFDEHIGEIIHCIQPPEDLRKKLAELCARDGPKAASLRHHAILPAIVGVLVLVGIAVFLYLQSLTEFPGREVVERMVQETGKMSGVELEPVTAPVEGLGDWFYMRGFEGYALPAELAGLPAVGSRVFQFDGRNVAQLAVDRQHLIIHVFDAVKSGVTVGEKEPWRIFAHEGWAAALQRHGANCYLLTFRGTEGDMRTFLDSLQKP